MSFDRGGILEAIKADRVNNQSTSYDCNLKVTLEFFLGCCTFMWNQENDWLIRECGVYPLNAPDSHFKQMELELGIKNKRPQDILESEHIEDGGGVGSSSGQGPLRSTKKLKELC